MNRIKREVKILTLFLTIAYGAFAEAQTQPQANGYGMGTGAGSVSATQTTTNSTTNSTLSSENQVAPGQNSNAGGPSSVQQTEPGQVTTVNPMDPINDSRRATDSQMLDIRRRRAVAPPVSATTEPREAPMGY